LQKDDIEKIKQDKTNIVEILDKKARRVFSQKWNYLVVKLNLLRAY
jgi:hypothetical protein